MPRSCKRELLDSFKLLDNKLVSYQSWCVTSSCMLRNATMSALTRTAVSACPLNLNAQRKSLCALTEPSSALNAVARNNNS